MAYNRVNFITNGFGKSSSRYDEDFSVPGPMRPTMGTQFAQPFADPYRINGVGFDIGGIFSGIGTFIGNIGKFAAPLLPGVGAAVANRLLTKTPTQPTTSSGSNFTQATLDEQAKLDAANAEKANRTIYIIVGGVALVGLYLILNRRRRRK